MTTRQDLIRSTWTALVAFWTSWVASLPVHDDWRFGAVYVRESHAESLEGRQPEIQLAIVLEIYRARHIYVRLENIYFDNVSAKSLEGRIQFGRLLEDAEAGQFAFVAAFEADRLFRSVDDATSVTRRLAQAGVQLLWSGKQESDWLNPANWMADHMVHALSEHVSRTTSYKVGTDLAASSKNGFPLGPLPEGYAVKHRRDTLKGRLGPPESWERVEPLATIIVQGRDRYVKGGSIKDLASWAEETELHGLTPAGKQMGRSWWRETLSNPKYAGYQMPIEYRGFSQDVGHRPHHRGLVVADLVPCQLPALFTLEEFLETRRVMAQRAWKSPGRRSPKLSPLSSLVVDARCLRDPALAKLNHRMHVLSRAKDGCLRAKCASACESRTKHPASSFILADIEQDVCDLVANLRFDDPRLRAEIERELRAFDEAPVPPVNAPREHEIARYMRIIKDSDSEGDKAIRNLAEQKLAELREEKARDEEGRTVQRFRDSVEDLSRWPEIWSRSSPADQNALLRAAVDRIVVEPLGRLPRGATQPIGARPRAARIIEIVPKDPVIGVAIATRLAKLGMERETGFEPATFCLGSRHSAS